VDRNQKREVIAELNEKFSSAGSAVVVSFEGFTVNEATGLRQKFREAGAEYRVVKNTLAKAALADTEMESLGAHFVGPTAIIFGYDDIVAPAKVLFDYFKANPKQEKIKVKAGVVQGKAIDAAGVETLSKMPGLTELRAQMLALFNTPATTLARLLNTPGEQLARVIKANADEQA